MQTASQKIEILAVENKSGTGKKSGNPYSMDVCQCVLHQADGSRAVGELILPKEHAKVVPGFYEAKLSLFVSFEKRIAGQVVELVKVASPARV